MLHNNFRGASLSFLFARHSWCHRPFQFSPRIFESFFVILVIRINRVNSSQSSSIIEFWLLVFPHLFFSILSVLTNFCPYFWPLMIHSFRIDEVLKFDDSMIDLHKISVAIFGSSATSCSNVRGVFPVHERFWFGLVQVSTIQFCCFPPVLVARASDGTDVPVSPLLASSSIIGSPDGSLPDLDGTGYRASSMEEKISEMFVQVAKLPQLMQSVSRFENCVQTLSQTVASHDAKITNIEPYYRIGKECNVLLPVDPARQDSRVPWPRVI